MSLREMSKPRTLAAPKAARKEARRTREAEWSPTMFYWGYAEMLFVLSILRLFYTTAQQLYYLSSRSGYMTQKRCFDGCTCNPGMYLEDPCNNHKARREATSHQRQCSCKSGKRTSKSHRRRAFRSRYRKARSVNEIESSGPRKSSRGLNVSQRLGSLGVDLKERLTMLGMRDRRCNGFLQCDHLFSVCYRHVAHTHMCLPL